MKSSEIRSTYLKYFEAKGHKILPSSSLIPSDPTVLLTLAGMLQFKQYFLGQEKPPFRRVTTVQKCVRMIDIEKVGKTARHHTFFEMLGNFSFGDYFKTEAIQYAAELLLDVFKLPLDKLRVAIYEKDEEAFAIWSRTIGFPADKIYRLSEENNFWAAGPTGPCGPCSEIYYDFGPAKGCGQPGCQPGCDCDRFLELWNLVFIQFNRNEKGNLLPLKTRGIDTGMGLERIAAVLQGVENNFETDLFLPLIREVQKLTVADKTTPLSLHIVADHIRAITHLISDGVIPENFGRGYVLRRLIRRAVRHGKLMGIEKPFLHNLAHNVVADMKETYPELISKEKLIAEMIKNEEQHFLNTLDQGLVIFRETLELCRQEKIISGELAFKLHDTYGFPVELVQEMAEDVGYQVDRAGFETEMEKQRDRGREAGLVKDKKVGLEKLDLEPFPATKFDGYEKNEGEATVIGIFSKEKIIVLDRTTFYAESGGQVGDTGILAFENQALRVIKTFTTPKGVFLHEVDDLDSLKVNMKVKTIIDASRRKATEIHHTATHLLQRALREILGDHVHQAGSYVGPDKLRFDYTHFAAMKPEELECLEEKVNSKIKEKLRVEVLQKSYKEALKMGALALFDEKYGEKVRVLKVDDYSLELCGGTHVKSTGEILFFKVLSESALGAGVRRIEAVAGQVAKIAVIFRAKSMRDEVEELIRKYRLLEMEKGVLGGAKFTETGIFEIEATELESLSKAVDIQDSRNVNKFMDHLKGRVDWLKDRLVKTQKEIEDLKLRNVKNKAAEYIAEVMKSGETNILIKEFKDYTMEMLRIVSDRVQSELKSCVIVLASVVEENFIFLITVTPDLVAKGCSARQLSDIFTAVVGGRGGGKETKVEGGAKDINRISEGFAKILDTVGK